jgi:hypothetical protein
MSNKFERWWKRICHGLNESTAPDYPEEIKQNQNDTALPPLLTEIGI